MLLVPEEEFLRSLGILDEEEGQIETASTPQTIPVNDVENIKIIDDSFEDGRNEMSAIFQFRLQTLTLITNL